jgi:hypothetical protein
VKQDLRKDVENGIDLGVPDGVLINGFGPYRYDDTLVPNGITYQIINKKLIPTTQTCSTKMQQHNSNCSNPPPKCDV